MMNSSRVYACANRACSGFQTQVRVFGQLTGMRFYSWPTLTCTTCGHIPQEVHESTVAPAQRAATPVHNRPKPK